jgi:hypothetical protein
MDAVTNALGELAAMKARGEISDMEFKEAKKIVVGEYKIEYKKRKGMRTTNKIILFLIGFIVIVYNIGGHDEKYLESQKVAGRHCMSGYYSPDFVASVKAQLRDPRSFEHISTEISPRDEKGLHRATMKYRARNGLGGMNVETAVGSIRNSDCAAVSVPSLGALGLD